MARKMIGLDVDHSSVRAAEVVRKGRAKVVTQLGTAPLAQGVVVDGKVENRKGLVEGLEHLLLEGGFTASSAILGLRSSWITAKIHKLPQMPKKELDKALEFEVPELVSFPVQSPQDVSFDYFINKQNDTEIEIVLVACPKAYLNPYIKAIRAVGLTLEAIDLPALSWQDLLTEEIRRAYVEISEEQTTVQVAIDGVFKVLRVVPVGTLHFREGVAEAFECSVKQAGELCSKHDLDYLLMEGSGNKRVIRATVQQFVGSVLQTLDFVRAQERATTFRHMLDELVVIGDLADLAGLTVMLEKELGIPARSLKQIEELQVGFDLTRPSRFSCFGSALALGLRGFDR